MNAGVGTGAGIWAPPLRNTDPTPEFREPKTVFEPCTIGAGDGGDAGGAAAGAGAGGEASTAHVIRRLLNQLAFEVESRRS